MCVVMNCVVTKVKASFFGALCKLCVEEELNERSGSEPSAKLRRATVHTIASLIAKEREP